jgi:hypothetical protein
MRGTVNDVSAMFVASTMRGAWPGSRILRCRAVVSRA